MKDSRTLWLCNAGMALVALGPALIPVYLTTLSEAFAIEDTRTLGQLPALLFTGFMAGIVVAGTLADRYGPKRFAVLGAAACAGGLVLSAAAWRFDVLLAGAITIGVGAGFLDMILSPIVSRIALDDRTRALNSLHAFYAVGAVGWLVIATAALQAEISWRTAFVLAAISPAMVAAAFAQASLPTQLHPGEERVRSRSLVFKPGFWLLMAMMVLVGSTEEGMNQWLPAFAELELGFSKPSAGMALAGFSVFVGVGRGLISAMPRSLSPYTLVGFMALLSSSCYVAAAWAQSPSASILACVATGLMCSVLWPTVLAMAATHYPNGGATMFGILTCAGNFGCLAAPWLIGIAAESTSLRFALGLAGSAPALIVVGAGVQYLYQYRATE